MRLFLANIRLTNTLVVDIYLTASQFGKYPGLATTTSVNNYCYIHIKLDLTWLECCGWFKVLVLSLNEVKPGPSNFPKIQNSPAYQKPTNKNIFCRIFSKLVMRLRKMVNIVGSLRERVPSFVFLCSPRALRAKLVKLLLPWKYKWNNGTTRLFSLRAEAVKEMRQIITAYRFAVTGAEKSPG